MEEDAEIPVQTLIKDVLREKGELTPKEIAGVLGDKTTYGTVRQELSNMAKAGDVEKPHRGVYALPNANNKGDGDEPRLAREPLKKIEPDTTRRPTLVINSGGKPWLAFYQAADADGTWILRAEVIGTATMDAGGGNLKLQSEYEPLETQ